MYSIVLGINLLFYRYFQKINLQYLRIGVNLRNRAFQQIPIYKACRFHMPPQPRIINGTRQSHTRAPQTLTNVHNLQNRCRLGCNEATWARWWQEEQPRPRTAGQGLHAAPGAQPGRRRANRRPVHPCRPTPHVRGWQLKKQGCPSLCGPEARGGKTGGNLGEPACGWAQASEGTTAGGSPATTIALLVTSQ